MKKLLICLILVCVPFTVNSTEIERDTLWIIITGAAAFDDYKWIEEAYRAQQVKGIANHIIKNHDDLMVFHDGHLAITSREPGQKVWQRQPTVDNLENFAASLAREGVRYKIIKVVVACHISGSDFLLVNENGKQNRLRTNYLFNIIYEIPAENYFFLGMSEHFGNFLDYFVEKLDTLVFSLTSDRQDSFPFHEPRKLLWPDSEVEDLNQDGLDTLIDHVGAFAKECRNNQVRFLVTPGFCDYDKNTGRCARFRFEPQLIELNRNREQRQALLDSYRESLLPHEHVIAVFANQNMVDYDFLKNRFRNLAEQHGRTIAFRWFNVEPSDENYRKMMIFSATEAAHVADIHNDPIIELVKQRDPDKYVQILINRIKIAEQYPFLPLDYFIELMISRLGYQHEAAAPAIELIADYIGNDSIEHNALWALGSIKTEQAHAILRKIMYGSDQEVAATALKVLEQNEQIMLRDLPLLLRLREQIDYEFEFQRPIVRVLTKFACEQNWETQKIAQIFDFYNRPFEGTMNPGNDISIMIIELKDQCLNLADYALPRLQTSDDSITEYNIHWDILHNLARDTSDKDFLNKLVQSIENETRTENKLQKMSLLSRMIYYHNLEYDQEISTHENQFAALATRKYCELMLEEESYKVRLMLVYQTLIYNVIHSRNIHPNQRNLFTATANQVLEEILLAIPDNPEIVQTLSDFIRTRAYSTHSWPHLLVGYVEGMQKHPEAWQWLGNLMLNNLKDFHLFYGNDYVEQQGDTEENRALKQTAANILLAQRIQRIWDEYKNDPANIAADQAYSELLTKITEIKRQENFMRSNHRQVEAFWPIYNMLISLNLAAVPDLKIADYLIKTFDLHNDTQLRLYYEKNGWYYDNAILTVRTVSRMLMNSEEDVEERLAQVVGFALVLSNDTDSQENLDELREIVVNILGNRALLHLENAKARFSENENMLKYIEQIIREITSQSCITSSE